MNSERQFLITQYDFTTRLFDKFVDNHYASNLWPIVYILSDGKVKEAYVGETTDVGARLTTHLRDSEKSKLTSVHLVTSEKFNKSATLDIESNLIKYMAGDGQYKLLNGNLGLANHNYYQKREIYWDIFSSIWDSLRAEGITQHSIHHIDNSDLFKYSPYKSLTKEQRNGLLMIIKNLINKDVTRIIVEGGAGTGKTILAIFLFKMLVSNNDDFNFKEFADDEIEFVHLVESLKREYPNPKMALVVPMASFRGTLKKVFKNIKGLSASMVIGPAEVVKAKFDILVVDESHRLRRRVNLGAYFGAFDNACKRLGLEEKNSNELTWVAMQSKRLVLFYDQTQSIKPSDTKKQDFDQLKLARGTAIEKLWTQFRVKGGNSYVDFINNLLTCDNKELSEYRSGEYELLLFDSIEEMISQIKKRNNEIGLSRLIAGYAWKWKSKKDKSLFDFEFDEVKLRWNSTSNDWINSIDAINEVGCIHTTQGYDLNYAGIIIGNELTYNKVNNEIEIIEENYFDKNGKQSILNKDELKDFIINIYKTIMLRGIRGTYVFVCDEALREYFSSHIPVYRENEIAIDLFIPIDEVVPFENCIPLYDLNIAAGNFGNIQKVEDVKWLGLPPKYKPSAELFACKVVGESMNKIIPDGSICLFRKYSGGSRNGLIVLVEHTDIQDSDFGSCYTIKEYESRKSMGDGWRHDSIILRPRSTDDSYQDLVLTDDDGVLVRVIGVFECVLF